MDFIRLDESNRVLGFRSGPYALTDKQPDEVVFDNFDTSNLMTVYDPENGTFTVDQVTLDYRDSIGSLNIPQPQDIQRAIVQATQDRLDAFARTRNYDGILSAATYATSTVPKFASEGQYAVEARDMTWATLYQILEEVQAGTRPVPESFADVEPDLPVLEWPA